MKRTVVALLCVAALLSAIYFLIPNEQDQAAGLTQAVVDAPGQAAPANGSADDFDQAITISSANTTIAFSCAKDVAGKTLVVHGGWNENFASVIEGAIGLDPDTRAPRGVRARVRIDSLWSEHDDLTHALLTAGFFQPQSFPWATFDGHYRPDAAPAAGDDAPTGTIAGAFVLNGIEKQIAFPVRFETTDERLSAAAAFSLDRRLFNVVFQDTAGYGLLTDANIADNVAVKLTIDAAHQPATEPATQAVAAAEADTPTAAASVPEADLPDAFVETIRDTQVSFDMVKVPGDGTGAPPFYVGRHEVTWDQFMPWVRGADLADEAQVGEQRAFKLRPSSPYGSVDRNFGMFKRPALGMSRLSAELFCAWLSEQTGRTYRLPTEAEWERAYLGSDDGPTAIAPPDDPDAVATYHDNAWSDSIGDWSTSKIGSRASNALGLYDMAGNAAEWVTDTGDDHVVRGGHFESPADELGVGRAIEDPDAWNLDYPNDPKSIWWYVNARWVGFRVVCEPLNIPPPGANP